LIFYGWQQIFVAKLGYGSARQCSRTAAARARAINTWQVFLWLVDNRIGPLATWNILRSDEITLIAQELNFMHIRWNIGDIGNALIYIMHKG